MKTIQGKVLRLQQQYFFTSCSLQDMIRIHLLVRAHRSTPSTKRTPFSSTIRTPPSPSPNSCASSSTYMTWSGTRLAHHRDTFSYTNHTLLPEALEHGRCRSSALLPRHLEIIYEINRRFLDEVRAAISRRRCPRRPDVTHRRARRRNTFAWPISPRRQSAVNGVAELHSQLLKTELLRDFYELGRRSSST